MWSLVDISCKLVTLQASAEFYEFFYIVHIRSNRDHVIVTNAQTFSFFFKTNVILSKCFPERITGNMLIK